MICTTYVHDIGSAGHWPSTPTVAAADLAEALTAAVAWVEAEIAADPRYPPDGCPAAWVRVEAPDGTFMWGTAVAPLGGA